MNNVSVCYSNKVLKEICQKNNQTKLQQYLIIIQMNGLFIIQFYDEHFI